MRVFYVLVILSALMYGGWFVSHTKTKQTPNATESVEQMKAKADQGNAEAQFKLGGMYYKGRGVPQDNAQAAAWYRKAAEQGDADAQYNLGVMYAKGLGVPQDNAQALAWYRKAAEQGYVKAQLNLGERYYKGVGAPQDYSQAAVWYRKAAEQGDAEAQSYLDGIVEARYIWHPTKDIGRPVSDIQVETTPQGTIIKGQKEGVNIPETMTIPMTSEPSSAQHPVPVEVTYYIDGLGSSNIKITINKAIGYTEYAGLKFRSEVVVNIWKEGTIELNREGVEVSNTQERHWVSRKLRFGKNESIVLIPSK